MIELLNIDCMEYMAKCPDKAFDLAIVDPPYGIGRDGHHGVNAKKATHNWKKYNFKKWDKKRPTSKYWKELFRISKNQIVWGGNYFTKHLPPSMGWIFWDKGQDLTMSDGELAFSSFDRALRRIKINRYELITDGVIHPTQKPIKLYKWLLEKYAKDGDKILDTHLGSGGIAIACHEYKFDLVGCEIDKDYYEAALKRYNNYISQTKLF